MKLCTWWCIENEKSAQRDANTARALDVVRFGHRPPVANTQTGPITIHCAAKLSAQCIVCSELVRLWGVHKTANDTTDSAAWLAQLTNNACIYDLLLFFLISIWVHILGKWKKEPDRRETEKRKRRKGKWKKGNWYALGKRETEKGIPFRKVPV